MKALASKHGSMKQATLNSLIRSLADVGQLGRALRLLSIMLNMALKPYRSTTNALIAGCARDFRSVEAARLYWCVALMLFLFCAPSCFLCFEQNAADSRAGGLTLHGLWLCRTCMQRQLQSSAPLLLMLKLSH